ncbi:MAG: hypothetical protein F8N39_11560 [Clostridiaceae bacterium]|nr:hypothetical protein [Clostridiaceae bacterium]
MTDRRRLPNRRDNSSRDFIWLGGLWTLTVGWTDDIRVGEVFLKGAKEGTDIEVAAEDDCFIASRLLQCGARVSDLARSLRAKRQTTGIVRPSLISVAIVLAAEMERDERRRCREMKLAAKRVAVTS